jgi:Kef-type K+ transport system membrane component KefB
MLPLASTLLLLAALLIAAKAGGWLSVRLKQPAILGELLVGVVLGPTALNILGWPPFHHPSQQQLLAFLGEAGVVLLMFLAGLEVDLEEFLAVRRPALLASLMGVALAILLVTVTTLPFAHDWGEALVLGLVLSATSVSISARTLLEMGKLRTQEGVTLLGAAVVDDLVALVVLGIFVAVADGESSPVTLLLSVVRMVLFLAAAVAVGLWLLPRIAGWVERQPVSEGLASLGLIAAFFFAGTAEEFGGIATITGAFVAGLALSRSPHRSDIAYRLGPVAYALLVPLFLVGVGLRLDGRGVVGCRRVAGRLVVRRRRGGQSPGLWSGGAMGRPLMEVRVARGGRHGLPRRGGSDHRCRRIESWLHLRLGIHRCDRCGVADHADDAAVAPGCLQRPALVEAQEGESEGCPSA